MLDGISAVLGALVVVTPFLCFDTGNFPAALSAFACGFAVMGLAYLDGPEPEPWTRWVSGVLGAWVAVSPWVLQRALVPIDAVLAPPMSEPAISMPVVLGFGIVVAAALDALLTAMEARRSIPLGQATAPAQEATSHPVPAIP
jgi:membrane associated rhomboid family serine protease